MGMKPRNKPMRWGEEPPRRDVGAAGVPVAAPLNYVEYKLPRKDHCGVSRGEITSWEHCECFACLTKQMRALDRLREQARRREGIKP